MVRSNAVGFGAEDCSFFSNSYAIAADGTAITPDCLRLLGGARWMMLWRELDDTAGLYLVVCVGDRVQWLPLRRPEPLETLKQRKALRAVIRGLTVSPTAATMAVGEDETK